MYIFGRTSSFLTHLSLLVRIGNVVYSLGLMLDTVGVSELSGIKLHDQMNCVFCSSAPVFNICMAFKHFITVESFHRFIACRSVEFMVSRRVCQLR